MASADAPARSSAFRALHRWALPGWGPLGWAGVAYLALLAAVLSPWGSFPAGFDAFWNLLVARTWAESGFPDRMPAAGFTNLADAYGDRQLLFHGLLRTLGGTSLDERWVPPLLWGLTAAQGAALWCAVRMWLPRDQRGTAGAWIFVLPALSQTWLFRTIALRDMLLGVLFLLPMLALAARRASAPPPFPMRGGVVLGICAAGFCYSHGAIVLPLVLWCLVALGGRFDTGRWHLRDGAWLALGTAVACLARPDVPAIFGVLATLNFGMPYANLRAEIGIVPAEFLGLPLRDLAAIEAPFLAACAVAAWAVWRRWLPWALALPTLFLVASALVSRRMFELAAPCLALALAAGWGSRLSMRTAWILAVGAAVVCVGFHLPSARRDAEANRMVALRDVGHWVAQRARPGDTVFVTDWGVSSPLAWYGRDAGIVCTGVIDPILMWAHDPAVWRDWRAIKERQAADPVATIRERFGARFVVVAVTDTTPGAALGATANYLRTALGVLHQRGVPFEVEAFPRPQDPAFAGNWLVVDLDP